MLTRLTITNYALIEHLDIDLHKGFSVITGETGAGKSIILGAIALLMGQRADSRTVRDGAQRCILEASFNLSMYSGIQQFFIDNDLDYDAETGDCILRRELTAQGKSRAFINDTPVSLTQMKELGSQLIDIHSQHQNLLLQQEDFQLSVLDILASNEDLLSAYQHQYKCLNELKNKLQQEEELLERSRQQQDFIQFQYNELVKANLTNADEQEMLEQKSLELSHSEEIKSALSESYYLLSDSDTSALNALHTSVQRLESISRVFTGVEDLASRLNSTYIEIKDIVSDIDRYSQQIEYNPSELEEIDARLDHLNALEQKYHVSNLAELIELRDTLSHQLDAITDGDSSIGELRQQIEKAEKECSTLAIKLSKARTKAATKALIPNITSYLHSLGLLHARIDVKIDTTSLSTKGTDKVQFLFSANPGTPLQPIADIASGGEIARVMLSLKAIISSAVSLPTIIFDEIDTGVSGAVAEKMAQIMRDMGTSGRQVLSITHLPQIAAMGAHHYHVSKKQTSNETITTMNKLDDDQRITEIAQMLSGSSITDAALENARQLLHLKN